MCVYWDAWVCVALLYYAKCFIVGCIRGKKRFQTITTETISQTHYMYMYIYTLTIRNAMQYAHYLKCVYTCTHTHTSTLFSFIIYETSRNRISILTRFIGAIVCRLIWKVHKPEKKNIYFGLFKSWNVRLCLSIMTYSFIKLQRHIYKFNKNIITRNCVFNSN